MNQTQPIVELNYHECVDLLYTQVIGRVALHTRIGTRLVPVNYSIIDDAIVWRTAAYSELATYGPDTDAVFEIDQLDHETHQGWSVIAYGRIQVVDDPEEVAAIRRVEDPGPWAEGLRHRYMRMPHQHLTGRRLGYAPHRTPLRDQPPAQVAETADD